MTPDAFPAPKPGEPTKIPSARTPETSVLGEAYRTKPSFMQAREMGAQAVSDAVDKNFDFLVGPFFGVEKGLIKSAAQMATDPVSGAVMAGSAGLSAVPGAAARTLELGLSTYFSTQAGKAMLNRFPGMAEKVKQRDWQGAAEEGGGALADGLMAYGAAMHVAHGTETLPAEYAKTAQQFRARFGAPKNVTGEVYGRPDPYGGIQQIPGETDNGGPGGPPPPPPGAPPGAPPPTEEAPPNAAEFIKAHNTWNSALNKSALEHMQTFGGSFDEAKAAVANSVGKEPQIGDFQATPKAQQEAQQKAAEEQQKQAEAQQKEAEDQQKAAQQIRDLAEKEVNYADPASLGGEFAEPGENAQPEKPVEPTPVDRVSPATPVQPTAATATEPEKPETIALQLQQLADGTRKVVMFPKGHGQPGAFPEVGGGGLGIRLHHDKFRNTYAYRPDLIRKSAINRAAEKNELPSILGGPMGMGAPDKSQLKGEPIAVVGRAAASPEAQAMAMQHVAGAALAIDRGDGQSAAAYLWKAAQSDPAIEADEDFTQIAKLTQSRGFDYHDPAYNDGVTQKPPEVQSAVTDAENLPVTHAATKMVTPEGGTVSIEHPGGVVGERQGAVPVLSHEDPLDQLLSSLPHKLAGAKPRYNYGNKPFDLDFESDIDKAAYITAQQNRSKHDAAYLEFAKKATGLTEAGVRTHGATVRNTIKAMAKRSEPGVLRIPASERGKAPPGPAQQKSTWEGEPEPSWWKTAYGSAVKEPWATVRDAYIKRKQADPSFGQTMMDYALDWGEGKAEGGIDSRATTQVEKPATQVEGGSPETREDKLRFLVKSGMTVKGAERYLDAKEAQSATETPPTQVEGGEDSFQYGRDLPYKKGEEIAWTRPGDGTYQHGTITRSTGKMYEVELPERGGSTLVPNTEAPAWGVHEFLTASTRKSKPEWHTSLDRAVYAIRKLVPENPDGPISAPLAGYLQNMQRAGVDLNWKDTSKLVQVHPKTAQDVLNLANRYAAAIGVMRPRDVEESPPPETHRQLLKAAKDAGVDASKFDLKTIEGRKALKAATAAASTPVKIPGRPNLAPDEKVVQDAVVARVEADLPGYVNTYLERFGTLFSSDNAARLFPEYDATPSTRGRYRYAVGSAANAIEHAAIERTLATAPPQDVQVVTGGAAAGKSSSVEPLIEHGYIVIDDPLSNTEQAENLINQILKAGHTVTITHVLRDPMEAFGANLHRSLTSPTEMGRTVPIDIFARTHEHSARVTQELAAKFAGNPDVALRIIINKTDTPQREGFIHNLREMDYTGLQERVNAALEAEHAAGKISDEIFANSQPRTSASRRGTAAPSGPEREVDGRSPEPEVSSEGKGEIKPSAATHPNNIVAAGDLVRGLKPGANRDFATDYLHYMTGSRGTAPDISRPPYNEVDPRAAALIIKSLEEKIGSPRVVHPKIVTPQITPAAKSIIPTEKPISSTDKSIQDLPVTATYHRNGDTVVVARLERKPIATLKITDDEWAATNKHPNPNYPRRKLAEEKLAQTNVAELIDEAASHNERMNSGVVNRLADSVVRAVQQARGEVEAPQEYRKLLKAAKDKGIDIRKYDLKTIVGRDELKAAIRGPNAGKRTEASNVGDHGAEYQGTARSDSADRTPGTESEGNGPDVVRDDSGVRGAENDADLAQPDTGGDGESVRRITGSADIPLTPDGVQQITELAKTKVLEPYARIYAAPNDRTQETARIVNDSAVQAETPAEVKTVESLDGWKRGAEEGQPAEAVKESTQALIMHPARVPAGVSPYSGEIGKSWNDTAIPFFSDVRDILRSVKRGERVLVITSGGNLQALNGWAKAGFPSDFLFHHDDMADEPHWSVTGKLFELSPDSKKPGLVEIPDNKEPGVSFMEHGETAFNPAAGEPDGQKALEPVRADDHPALADELPAGDDGAGTVRPVGRKRGGGGGGGRRRGGSGVQKGPELEPGEGAIAGVVANPAEPEGTFPPRSPDVANNSHERDFRIPDGRKLSGSPEFRARTNIEAIKTLRQIEAENRLATVDEQKILAHYMGWGAVPQLFAGNTPEWQAVQDELRGLISEDEYKSAERSTTNAHYTGDNVVDAMWKAVQHLGGTQGMSWLEPAVGTGNYFGRQPVEMLPGARRVGVEKDQLTGAIAKLLYPDSGVDIMPFERAELPNDYFDGAVSNVPFGNFGVHDQSMKKFLTSSIHNYFFAKSLLTVRPGGIIAFITSRYTLDGYDKPIQMFREWMAERADLLGAVRLPSGAFRANAGTDVITDVIFLRKRLPGAEGNGVGWTESKPKPIPAKQSWGGSYNIPIRINEYFHDHPEMLLGTEGISRGMHSSEDYDLKGTVTDESLAEALAKLPANSFQDWRPTGNRARSVALRELKMKPDEIQKLGGMFFDEKGDLYRKLSNGAAIPVEVSPAVKTKIRGQLQIRDDFAKLNDAELSNASDDDVAKLRRRLNTTYDLFVKEHGPLYERSNRFAMEGDPDAPTMLSLERNYEPGNKSKGIKPKVKKADIFDRRLRPQNKPIESAGNSKEALYIALNETGNIDFGRMQQLTGKTPEQLQQDLAGIIYEDPSTRTWLTADEYLSGSVRSKLKEARAIAKIEPKYEPNVKALEAAQPEDIPPSGINVALGVTWVPLDLYQEFAQHLLGAQKPVKVNYVKGEWYIDNPYGQTPERWKTKKVSAYDLLVDTFNTRSHKVYMPDGDGGRMVDKDETLAARNKQREISEHFQEWLFGDPKRSEEMVRLYNDLNNDLRLWQADGSHLTFPGMVKDPAVVRGGDLDPHQKNAAWRQIKQRNVLIAHAVGAGKTFELIAAGMELKRLGLAKRLMYVVPNATLTGWQLQFNALYPGARVLIFSEKDLAKDRRRLTIAQIATGDYDAVVVPHSSFQFIPTGDEIFNEHYNELEAALERNIKDAEEAEMDTRQIKRLQKAKERLLKSLMDKRNEDKKDQTITWEQLGIDQLFVDESHVYRKLGFQTKQGNIAGIDTGGNQMTFDLLMKIRHVQKFGRGVVFATGTPVVNTLGELYSLMRYLIDPELKARGLGTFDEWDANYGRTIDVFEPKVEGGGYQMKARHAQFVNLPELSQLFRSFADVVTSDMLNVPRPELVGGARRALETQISPGQEAFLHTLHARGARIRSNPSAAAPDNMLAIFTDAQKMSLDLRMVDPNAVRDPNGRIATAAREIKKLYDESSNTPVVINGVEQPLRGTQLVMSDMGKPVSARSKRKSTKTASGKIKAPPITPDTGFSVYDALIQELVDNGIPANEIAHIYQAKNKNQRSQLFRDVNDGKIRVLLGSTQKMGIGVNVQDRLYGLMHLDITHTPAELEQREGRILRQGNVNPQVHVIYNITSGTLDEMKFGNVIRKGKFINAYYQGKSTVRESEDVSGMVLSMEMFQAMASGDPRVLRKMEVDAEVDRLSSVHAAWQDQKWAARRDSVGIPGRIGAYQKEIRQYKEAAAVRDATGRVFQVGKEKFEGEGITEEVSNALLAAARRTAQRYYRMVQQEGSATQQVEIPADKVTDLLQSNPDLHVISEAASKPVPIGMAFGLPISSDGHTYFIAGGLAEVPVGTIHPVEGRPLAKTAATRIQSNISNHFDHQIKALEENITHAESRLVEMEKFLTAPFSRQAEYDKLVKEQKELFVALGGMKSDDAVLAADDNGQLQDASVAAAEPSEDEEEDDGAEEEGDEGEEEDQSPTALAKTLQSGRGAVLPDAPKIKATATSGPISAYEAGDGEIEAPAKWYHQEVDGDNVYSDGSFALKGATPEGPSSSIEGIGKFLKEPENAVQVRPLAYSLTKPVEDIPAYKVIWLGPETPIQAKYFDYIKKQVPDATFWVGEDKRIVTIKSGDDVVGVVMGIRAIKPPGRIEPLLESPGTYMGMGFGALQPTVDRAGKAAAQFAREEILPKVEAVLGGGKQAVAGFVHMVAPRVGVPNRTLDTIYRMRGGTEAADFLLASKLDKWSDRVEKMSQAQMIDFVDKMKGTSHSVFDQDLQDLADFIRRVDDAVIQQVQKYKPSAAYMKDHFRVLWKVIPGQPTGATGGFKGVGRAPIQGSKGFLKMHTLADMSEGIAKGGVPVTYNPLRMFQLGYADAMKFIQANRLWAAFKRYGVRKFVKFGRRPPPGFVKFDDPIALSYLPVKQGMVKVGEWYVEKGAARLLNNMLSRDYLRNIYEDKPFSMLTGSVGKAMVGIKNATTAVELSFSPFHAVFESIEAMSGALGIALREMINLGDWKNGLLHLLQVPISPYTFAKYGSMAKQSYGDLEQMKKTVGGRKWLASNPEAALNIPYFFLGGGKMTMPEDFRIKAASDFTDYWNSAWRDGIWAHHASYALRAIPALHQLVMNPLFDIYIPNLKLGFFLKEFGLARKEFESRLLSGEMTHLQLARQVVDSVESRFGEMNFDNLYWNRTFKTAAQIIFRSVTWKLGSGNAVVRAITDQLFEFQRAARMKEPPKLNQYTAWLIGTALVTAIGGSLITMALGRRKPEGVKDAMYPVIDDKTGMRISMATYLREIMHFGHSPWGWVKSSAAGDIGKALDIWENQDFYGNDVRNEDDPAWKQVAESLQHLFPVPISLSSYLQAKQEGGNSVAKYSGLVGFPKAPKYIEQTAAERKASEYTGGNRKTGGRTAFEADRSKAESRIRNLYRRGDTAEADKAIAEAEDKGLIDSRDVRSIAKQSGAGYLKGAVKGLSMPQALRVYEVATDKEQDEIRREVRDKVQSSAKHHPGEFGQPNSTERKLALKYFNFRAPIPHSMGTPQAVF